MAASVRPPSWGRSLRCGSARAKRWSARAHRRSGSRKKRPPTEAASRNYWSIHEINMAGRSSPPLSWGNWKWSARGRRISGMDTPATPLSLYVRLDLSSLLICATFKLGHCEIQIRPLQRCFFGSVSCLRRTVFLPSVASDLALYLGFRGAGSSGARQNRRNRLAAGRVPSAPVPTGRLRIRGGRHCGGLQREAGAGIKGSLRSIGSKAQDKQDHENNKECAEQRFRNVSRYAGPVSDAR